MLSVSVPWEISHQWLGKLVSLSHSSRLPEPADRVPLLKRTAYATLEIKEHVTHPDGFWSLGRVSATTKIHCSAKFRLIQRSTPACTLRIGSVQRQSTITLGGIFDHSVGQLYFKISSIFYNHVTFVSWILLYLTSKRFGLTRPVWWSL